MGALRRHAQHRVGALPCTPHVGGSRAEGLRGAALCQDAAVLALGFWALPDLLGATASAKRQDIHSRTDACSGNIDPYTNTNV